jgi:hypothetical protein
MFNSKKILKYIIVFIFSLSLPVSLSIFQEAFNDAVLEQQADIAGENTLRIRTIDNSTPNGNREQSVFVDFRLPRVGAIQNLSQRPFRFPRPTQSPVSSPVNNSGVSTAPIDPLYGLSEDGGNTNNTFNFAYLGVRGSNIAFYNGNSYDLNNVRIEVNWIDGGNSYTSIYSTFKISAGQYYYNNKNNTAEATIPYNPSKIVVSISMTFTDNTGTAFSFNL